MLQYCIILILLLLINKIMVEFIIDNLNVFYNIKFELFNNSIYIYIINTQSNDVYKHTVTPDNFNIINKNYFDNVNDCFTKLSHLFSNHSEYGEFNISESNDNIIIILLITTKFYVDIFNNRFVIRANKEMSLQHLNDKFYELQNNYNALITDFVSLKNNYDDIKNKHDDLKNKHEKLKKYVIDIKSELHSNNIFVDPSVATLKLIKKYFVHYVCNCASDYCRCADGVMHIKCNLISNLNSNIFDKLVIPNDNKISLNYAILHCVINNKYHINNHHTHRAETYFTFEVVNLDCDIIEVVFGYCDALIYIVNKENIETVFDCDVNICDSYKKNRMHCDHCGHINNGHLINITDCVTTTIEKQSITKTINIKKVKKNYSVECHCYLLVKLQSCSIESICKIEF